MYVYDINKYVYIYIQYLREAVSIEPQSLTEYPEITGLVIRLSTGIRDIRDIRGRAGLPLREATQQ